MSIETPFEPLCPGCREVLALLDVAQQAVEREPEPDPVEVIEGMAFLLEATLTHLLAGFDYAAQRDSRLGMAAQLLSVAAVQAEGLRMQIDQVRRTISPPPRAHR